MFSKTLIAAFAVAILTGATLVAPTTASAKDGRNAAAVAGALAGIGGALLASSIDHRDGYSQVGYRERRHGGFRGHGFRGHDHGYSNFGHGRPGYGYGNGHDFRGMRCFEKPITRWSRFEGRPITVGSKKICR